MLLLVRDTNTAVPGVYKFQGMTCHGPKVRAGPGRADRKIVIGRTGPGREF